MSSKTPVQRELRLALRKDIRAFVVAAIEGGRPLPVNESLILSALQCVPIVCSEREVRRVLCFLEDKGAIHLDRSQGEPWQARIANRAARIPLSSNTATPSGN